MYTAVQVQNLDTPLHIVAVVAGLTGTTVTQRGRYDDGLSSQDLDSVSHIIYWNNNVYFSATYSVGSKYLYYDSVSSSSGMHVLGVMKPLVFGYCDNSVRKKGLALPRASHVTCVPCLWQRQSLSHKLLSQ